MLFLVVVAAVLVVVAVVVVVIVVVVVWLWGIGIQYLCCFFLWVLGNPKNGMPASVDVLYASGDRKGGPSFKRRLC